jgi:DNA-binding SARP family transcriptional activator
VKFRVLGPIEVTGAAGQPVKVPPRERIVLGVLLLDAGCVVSIDRLVDAVWNETPPPTARKQILICVSVLRRLLRTAGFDGEIASHAPGYALHPGPDADLDLHTFGSRVAAGREAVDDGRPAAAVALFQQALALWRGEPLAGTGSRILQAAAVGLVERKLAVAETCADLRLTLGIYPGLVEDLHRLITVHPLRETLYSRLMRALAHNGRRAEAMEVYRSAHRTFTTEVGLEPGDELRRLRTAILDGAMDLDLDLAGRALPARLQGSRQPC